MTEDEMDRVLDRIYSKMESKTKTKGKKVRITKLSDDYFKNVGEEHPNGIYEGYVKKGIELKPPTVGERYYIGIGFSTSPVTKIIDENTIKTTYSTYKIEYINE